MLKRLLGNRPATSAASSASSRCHLNFLLFIVRTLIPTKNMLIRNSLPTTRQVYLLTECTQLLTQLCQWNSSHQLQWHKGTQHLEAPNSHMACHEIHLSSIAFQKCGYVTQSAVSGRDNCVCWLQSGGQRDRWETGQDANFSMNTGMHDLLSPVIEHLSNLSRTSGDIEGWLSPRDTAS